MGGPQHLQRHLRDDPRLQEHHQPAAYGFPDARRFAETRAGLAGAVGAGGPLCADPAEDCPSRARVRAARRPAVCQRCDPHRPCGQQDPQGHGGQVQAAGRLPRAVRAGLGLPRPADRDRGGEEVRQAGRQARRRRVPAEVPRVRHRAGRHAARRLQAAWRARRLGAPLSHHGFQVRGRHAARAGAHRGERPRAARRQAGVLVLRLRLRAG